MQRRSFMNLLPAVLMTCSMFFACIQPSLAQEAKQGKILGGYFEEWGIYYAGYNIANLQENGVADKLTHLIYAFANVNTTPSPACSIADSWADYQTPYLPSVSGVPYAGPMYGNFAAIQQLKLLHPNLKVLMSMGGASSANTAAFVAAAGTEAGRRELASSCIGMFVQGNIAAGITAPGLLRRLQHRLGVSHLNRHGELYRAAGRVPQATERSVCDNRQAVCPVVRRAGRLTELCEHRP